MSTKETLPQPEFVILYDDPDHQPEYFCGDGAQEAAEKTFADRLLKWSCYLFVSRTRLDAAEKELVFHNHRCEARHNEGQAGMPQGDCQCLICAGFYKELTQLKEANATIKKELALAAEQVSITSTELTEATEANAELVKDGVHVFLDDRVVPILLSAVRLYSSKLDLNSPHGGYENAFCIDLIAHLNAAIEDQAIDAAAAKGTQ
jgi:hypothetical protein